MAWTVPRRTTRSMSEFATTPGNRLVMPCSSTAAGASGTAAASGVGGSAGMAHAPSGARTDKLANDWARGARYRPPRARCRSAASRRLLRSRRDGDGPSDDLGLVRLDLGLVRVDLRVGRRVTDAALLQTEPRRTGRELAVRLVLDEVEDRGVDALERGRQDQRLLVRGGGEVLVGVDPDRDLLLLHRGLEQPSAGATRSVVDDIRPAVVLALSGDLG